MRQPSQGLLPVFLFLGAVSARIAKRQEADNSITQSGQSDRLASVTGQNTVPVVTLSGSDVPTPTYTLTASLSVTSDGGIPTLTFGQTLSATTSATASRHSHGLGIPSSRPTTSTLSFAPSTVDWSAVIAATSSLGPPAPAPTGFIEVVGENGGNMTTSSNTTIKTTKRGLPDIVDWRNRWGFNWITSIQNQGWCGSCWAFSATALMESMVRIQHGAWSKRSEADLHDGMGSDCETGSWPELALTWAFSSGNGIADAKCDPYWADDRLYYPCADRSGRTLHVPAYQVLTKVEDQKMWLDKVGPVTGVFEIFTDFDAWTPDRGVYRYDNVSSSRGLHAVLVVGYDDIRQCWIIKNSWGSWSGDKGYYYLGYGEVQIDSFPKLGLSNVDPDPWDRKSHQNGLMFQGGSGSYSRNFELVRASPYGGFTHIRREDTYPNPWYQSGSVTRYGAWQSQFVVGQPLIISTSFRRDFEVLYLSDDNSLRHWYYSQASGTWSDTDEYFWNIGGYPGYVQTDDSNFSLVVRKVDGSLAEFTRDAITANFVYARDVASSGIKQSGPALVQSNVGLDYSSRSNAGNLYVAAVRDDGQMQLFWRSMGGPDGSDTWNAGEVFGQNVSSTPPVMVQDYWRTVDEKTPGGFQLCVAVDGKVQHWQRINTDIATEPPKTGELGKWEMVATFGEDVKHVWSLMQGANHQLEMVLEDNEARLWHWAWEYPGTWSRKALIPDP